MSSLHFFYPVQGNTSWYPVLKIISEFAFREGDTNKICVLNNTAYWIKNSSTINSNCSSLISLKQAVKYLFQNCLFKVGSQTFPQVTDIPRGSDPAPFFVNLCQCFANVELYLSICFPLVLFFFSGTGSNLASHSVGRLMHLRLSYLIFFLNCYLAASWSASLTQC